MIVLALWSGSGQHLDGAQPGIDKAGPAGDGQLGPAQSLAVPTLGVHV